MIKNKTIEDEKDPMVIEIKRLLKKYERVITYNCPGELGEMFLKIKVGDNAYLIITRPGDEE